MNGIGVSYPEKSTAESRRAAPNVSALITISAQDTDITYVRDALEGLFAQSVRPGQLIAVIDSSFADGIEALIAGHRRMSDIESVEIMRVPDNRSLATMINDAIDRCTGDWIMCLNGDSICHQDRLAIQLDYIARYPEIDAWFSWCEEIADGSKRTKASAIFHDAVVDALRWRNVLSYSTGLIRSSELRGVGGFSRDRLGEYDLFVRLALAEANLRVIPAALVSVPAVPRGGVFDAWQEACFRVNCFRSGFLNFRQFLVVVVVQSLFLLLAAPLRRRLYCLVRTYGSTPTRRHAIHYSPDQRVLADAS